MKVHVLQHVPFEGLGSIREWLDARGAAVTFTRFFAGEALPELAAIDLVIIMGGPMSVNDEALFPWLVAEKRFVAAAVADGKAVLGVCLGAQLIANALGSRVYPGPCKEIGWHDIRAVANAAEAFRFPAAIPVFHWHGETFDLPTGAVHLASSAACVNQAFQVGRRAIGLQFHLETTPAAAEAMLANCGNELVAGPCIHSAEQIRSAPATAYAASNRLMTGVLDYLTG